jgi:hypothetical protein
LQQCLGTDRREKKNWLGLREANDAADEREREKARRAAQGNEHTHTHTHKGEDKKKIKTKSRHDTHEVVFALHCTEGGNEMVGREEEK